MLVINKTVKKSGKLSIAKLNYISLPVDREMLENLLRKLV